MEDVIAVEVELAGGAKCYFLTFGRVQDAVDPEPVAKLVLTHARAFKIDGVVTSARVCSTLREAADSTDAPYFYENLLRILNVVIPFGDQYAEWRARVGAEMQRGKHLYFCGRQG